MIFSILFSADYSGPKSLRKENQGTADGRRFTQKSSHLDTSPTALAGHLSGKIVEDSLLAFFKSYRRSSAIIGGC